MTALAIAFLLDAALGEPRWLWSRVPHPAVLMGRAIGGADQRFNHGPYRRARGCLVLTGLTVAAILLGLALSALPGQIIDILIAAILLAQRSLVDHVRAVAAALRMSVSEGRRAVAMIVGRDTRAMDGPAISRAAIESGAENFSDGVIAPALFFGLFGLPGILAYKLVNTADSMIGYRTDLHRDFGWAAARFDDLLNWVPARLSAALIWLASAGSGRWSRIARDAALHRSPNAGWPEAAMAPALGVALAGPRSYDGQLKPFPFVNPEGRPTATAADIDATCRFLWTAWSIALAIAVILGLVLS